MPANQITIRDLRTQGEYDQCVALQRVTWGDDFRELVPPVLLLVAQKVGGIVAGAFDARGELVGFVFGLSGVRDGRPAHWSHMLAVQKSLRNRGIGRRLKLYQRTRARDMGITHIYWTFDPLVARNAHLNLNRLGAQVMEYVPDMYGSNPISKLDSVIGTDRFVVKWHVTPEADQAEIAPVPTPGAPVVTPHIGQDSAAPAPDLPAAHEVWVEVPNDIQALKARAPEAAAAWRATTRRALVHYLERGYAVRGLARNMDTRQGFYVVRRPEAADA